MSSWLMRPAGPLPGTWRRSMPASLARSLTAGEASGFSPSARGAPEMDAGCEGRGAGAGDGDFNEPLAVTVRTRVAWLVVNLGATMLSASVVGLFQGEIARFALLAALMPIVSALGGNAGTQTLAVVVRALATHQLTSSNTLRMLLREFRVAIFNGIALGAIGALGSYVILGNAGLSVVFAVAMIINSIVAGLVGVMVPVALDKANVDPAVSSAVFVTTMTDVMGFFSFLGLAALWGLGG